MVIIFIQILKDLIGEIVSIKIVSIKYFNLSFAGTGYSWHVKCSFSEQTTATSQGAAVADNSCHSQCWDRAASFGLGSVGREISDEGVRESKSQSLRTAAGNPPGARRRPLGHSKPRTRDRSHNRA